jgi:hypothetical protein
MPRETRNFLNTSDIEKGEINELNNKRIMPNWTDKTYHGELAKPTFYTEDDKSKLLN